MIDNDERYGPNGRRLAAGFVLAPLLASGAPFALATLLQFVGDPVGFVRSEHESIVGDAIFIALVGAYPMTVVIGLPLFLLLLPFTRWVGYGPIVPILTGFAIAFAGTVGLQATDHRVHADGYFMGAGVGLDGAFGGLVFWLVAVGLDPRWHAMRRRHRASPIKPNSVEAIASKEAPKPLVIRFEDMPAGLFESGEAPAASGLHAYMPFRSLSHLRMVEAVHGGLRPRCCCRIGGCTVTFVILALPKPHSMLLAEVDQALEADATG